MNTDIITGLVAFGVIWIGCGIWAIVGHLGRIAYSLREAREDKERHP